MGLFDFLKEMRRKQRAILKNTIFQSKQGMRILLSRNIISERVNQKRFRITLLVCALLTFQDMFYMFLQTQDMDHDSLARLWNQQKAEDDVQGRACNQQP